VECPSRARVTRGATPARSNSVVRPCRSHARDGRIPLRHRPRDRARVEAVFLSPLHKAGGGATVGNSRR
jgi:hypothetical protein